MKRPEPPFLGLEFYFPEISDADAYAGLLMALLKIGARFTGETLVQHGLGIRDKPFATITEGPTAEMVTLNEGTLAQHLKDPNVRVVQVYMQGATSIAPDVMEIVSYESISSEAAAVDRHPVAIWAEGWLFEGTFPGKHPQRAAKAGRKAYERLWNLVEDLAPAYAAITREYALECPTDLRRDPRSYAFLDFYVDEQFLGAQNSTAVQHIFQDGYIKRMAGGLYVSCSREFNPKKISLNPEDAIWRSVEMAKLIASVVS